VTGHRPTSPLVDGIVSARSVLFVPGDRPDRFPKAMASGADEIVLDLEDAVAPDDKGPAREHVRRWRETEATGVVRINGAGTQWHEDDVAALADRPCVVMLPKAVSPAQITRLMNQLAPGSCVIPLLESALGVLDARHVAAAPGVARVAFGNADLAGDLGVDPADRTALAHARASTVLASAACRLAPPLDGVTLAIADHDLLRADAEHAAALGFSGKLCIHPSQVPIVNEIFSSSPEELAWAREVLAAAGESVTVVDGQMIDKPLLAHARRLLARAPANGRSDD
jgi:citrate lyase subunit beta / citryl-CoA lyase